MPFVRVTKKEKAIFPIYRQGLKEYCEKLTGEQLASQLFQMEYCDACFMKGKTVPLI